MKKSFLLISEKGVSQDYPAQFFAVLWIRNDILYSGSLYSYEFSEFRVRIQMQIRIQPIPYYLSKFGEKNKFNQKEESTNYLPFSISYYSPTVQYTHTVQNTQALD